VAQSNTINVSRDVLTGDRVGVNTVADIGGGVTREVLTGDRYGHDWYNDVLSASRDVLTGDRVGLNVYGDVASVVREVLLKDPPLRAAVVTREALVSMTGDSLSVARTIKEYRQAVVMVRPTMALPSTVHSPRYAASLREQITMSVSRQWARSIDYAATLQQQTVMHRITTAAPLMQSWRTVKSLTMLTALSRGIVYTPVSELRVKSESELVAQRRNFTPAPQVRTAITAYTLVQQFIASRAQKVVVITTDADVSTLVEQTIQASGRPAPHSPIDDAFLTEMVVQQRTVVPPNSGENVMQEVQQAVQFRVPAPPHGDDIAASLFQQTVIPRDVVTQRSTTRAASLGMLTVLHRDTYAPAYALGRHTSTLRMQAVMQRIAPAPHSITRVVQLRLGFILGRTVPAPWDVIDPAIGRHAKTLVMQSILHRNTIPPATISTQSRYAFSVAEHAVVGDTFPAPDYPPPIIPETDAYQVAEQFVMGDDAWGPVSAVTATQVAGHVVVGDNSGWIDPVVPQSDVTVEIAAEALVVGDVFPPADMSQSDAEVAGLVEAVALGDSTFPNSMIPQSVVQVRGVTEFAAVGDAQFPDPMIPASAVRSSLVGAVPVVRDPSMQGNFGMSEIEALLVLEFALIRDPTLVGIPRRTGPRPIVTVSMS
jgi:hypothetical protein